VIRPWFKNRDCRPGSYWQKPDTTSVTARDSSENIFGKLVMSMKGEWTNVKKFYQEDASAKVELLRNTFGFLRQIELSVDIKRSNSKLRVSMRRINDVYKEMDQMFSQIIRAETDLVSRTRNLSAVNNSVSCYCQPFVIPFRIMLN
jgi:hypothetical protein